MKLTSILRLATVAVVTLTFEPLSAAPPATFPVSELTFKRPEGWEWVEVTSQMRKAQLKVADAKSGASAEVIFFHFGPGAAGGTKANVDRWLAMFTGKAEPKSEEITVGKTKVTYVHTEGTYQSGMPGGPKTSMPDHGLLGAIIEAEQGSVFVRMTGPKALVKSSQGEFKKMIEGALKKE